MSAHAPRVRDAKRGYHRERQKYEAPRRCKPAGPRELGASPHSSAEMRDYFFFLVRLRLACLRSDAATERTFLLLLVRMSFDALLASRGEVVIEDSSVVIRAAILSD